ncbi:MAG: hypothetical protein O7E52_17405 [Candidatus Poribacteria bacterium]|nr:hypothetical protein [Candidatus Poribacteria bacterium]
MITQWQNLAWICLFALVGCSGKAVSWLEQPTGLEQKIQKNREERIKYEPIVPSNAEQRLKWRNNRSKAFHKMRQLYNPEYEDYSYRCLVGDTLTLYLKQEKQIQHEKINRPNKRRPR